MPTVASTALLSAVMESSHFPVAPAREVLWRGLQDGGRENRWVLYLRGPNLAIGAAEMGKILEHHCTHPNVGGVLFLTMGCASAALVLIQDLPQLGDGHLAVDRCVHLDHRRQADVAQSQVGCASNQESTRARCPDS